MFFGGRGVIGSEKIKLCKLSASIISQIYIQICKNLKISLYKHSKNLFFLSIQKKLASPLSTPLVPLGGHVPQVGNPCHNVWQKGHRLQQDGCPLCNELVTPKQLRIPECIYRINCYFIFKGQKTNQKNAYLH